MSNKFIFALIILPILAVASYVGLRLYQVKLAKEAAALIEAEGGTVEFKDDKIFFFIPVKKVTTVFINSKSNRLNEQLARLGRFSDLEILSLQDCKISGENLKLLAHLKNLKKLNLGCMDITDDDLKLLTPLKELMTLYLSCTDVTDEGMSVLAELPSLKYLELSLTCVSSEGVQRLPTTVEVVANGSKIDARTLPGRKLTIPDLGEGPVPSDELILLAKEFERLIGPLSVYIVKSKSTARGYSHLARMSFNPEGLNQRERRQAIELIGQIVELSDVHVGLIQEEANSSSITLAKSPSFDAVLSELCEIELYGICVQSRILTSEQLEKIWACDTIEEILLETSLPKTITLPGRLREVFIFSCCDLTGIDIKDPNPKLKELYLSGCIPSSGIAFLAKCKDLESLNIVGIDKPCDLSVLAELPNLAEFDFSINCDGLKLDPLEKCRSLQKLNIRCFTDCTDLSEEKIQELREALPDTEIEVD